MDFLRTLNKLNISILEWGEVYAGIEWNHRNIISPFNRLYCFLDGEAYIQGEKQVWTMIPGRVYLVPANAIFDYICINKMHKLYFHFNIDIIGNIDVFGKQDSIMECIAKEEQISSLRNALNCPSVKNTLKIKSIIEEMISDFIDDDYTVNENLINYSNILEQIEETLSAKFRVNQLNLTDRVDLYEFSRRFKKDTGVSIKVYAEALLIRRIKELLLTTDLSIKEISAKFDFCDQYYLSRFFKKIEGISPKAYRERNQINKTM